ncbi:hypothetical protein [Geotalea uraniireducens]|uniref:hypothetical protein n=1 Tax=Geotalea uraniireducens TaxID=351604 RepID=UPI0012ECE86B|nr:hypothetical protein [Geotalea uraniireducens]
MPKKVTLKISAAAAPYVRSDTPKTDKLRAARAEVSLAPNDLMALLFYLSHDQDADIKVAALKSLRELSEPLLMTIVDLPDINSRLLDVIARLHFPRQAVAEKVALHPNCDDGTRRFLAEKGILCFDAMAESASQDKFDLDAANEDDKQAETAEDAEVAEEEEAFKSKYQLSQQLGVADKIKMALTGDKEWRSILLKDSNKLVSGSVVKNPRITEGEILTISKSNVQNDEIMRVICANKEWVKNYQIRKALVENHKTPLPVALRFMASLTEKDLAFLAKSKNVSSVISTQSRRILMNKSKK